MQPSLWIGTGDPNGQVTANRGAAAFRTDGGEGSSVYIKESNDGADTGWTAVTSGGAGGPASQLSADGTTLDVNAITDGTILQRSGTTIVGTVPISDIADALDAANAAAVDAGVALAALAALAPIASSGSASDLSTGTVPVARLPAATTSAIGAVELATDREAAADRAVQGNDSRLAVRTETLSGLMPANMGRRASLATNLSIANTLTQVVGFTAAANTLAVGTVIRFKGIGLQTNTTGASTSVLTCRANAGSLGSNIHGSWSVAMGTTARTNCPFVVEAEFVVVSTGSGGTARACVWVQVNTATALATPTTMVTGTVSLNTTISNVVELACISGASTTSWNFISATAEVVQP